MKYLIKILCLLFILISCDNDVVEAVHGCFDSEACNYNPNASYDNNSCEYETCADCEGIPYGDALEDQCGICQVLFQLNICSNVQQISNMKFDTGT